jgi:hypothetical protein
MTKSDGERIKERWMRIAQTLDEVSDVLSKS